MLPMIMLTTSFMRAPLPVLPWPVSGRQGEEGGWEGGGGTRGSWDLKEMNRDGDRAGRKTVRGGVKDVKRSKDVNENRPKPETRKHKPET
jgi:hypothetical protein